MGYMKELAIEQANRELEELYSDHAMEQYILGEEKLQHSYYKEYKEQLNKENSNE